MKVIDLSNSEEGDVPLKKKMKQAQLPFQTVSPKIRSTIKRKLSDTSLPEENVIKQIRTEKENISDEANKVILLSESIVQLSDDSNDAIHSVKTDKSNILNLNSITTNLHVQEYERANVQTSQQCESVAEKGSATNAVADKHLNSAVNELIKIVNKSERESQRSSSMFVKPFDDSTSDDFTLVLLSDSDDDSEEIISSDSDDTDDMNVNNESNCSSNSPSVKVNDSNSKVNTPTSKHIPVKKITPKQIQSRAESAKKQEERIQKKLESEKRKQREKEERMKLKQERLEQKRKEREEREELKRKEREEKEKKRQQELDLKNEERKMKDEVKRLKEEDKRRKEEQREEEKLKKEQERELLEEKKRKAAKAFVSFFVPKKSDQCSANIVKEQTVEHNFMPFAIKSDMRVAPLTRSVLNNQQINHLDNLFNVQNVQMDSLYLSELKNGKMLGKSSRTWPVEDLKNDEDVVLIEDTDVCSNVVETIPVSNKMKVKLLQFTENRRPPYWGTWRKSSSKVKPRNPLSLDKNIFDYDIDSDEEWEEEEPGESLHGSDDEKDKESEDEYEVDNEFFVPHGYLSDEEAQNEEDELSLTPETQKARLKHLELEFEAEMKHKTERLKPRLIGCVWEYKDIEKPAQISDSVWQYLRKYEMIFSDDQHVTFSEDNLDVVLTLSEENMFQKKFICLPEKYIPDFIKLIHGNSNGRMFLTKEFQAYLMKIDVNLKVSKRNIQKYLQNLASWRACPDEGPVFGKTCWYVDKQTRDKYNSDAVLPNSWNYILTPKRKSLNYSVDTVNDNTEESSIALKKNEHNIKKFVKVMSEDERKQKFAAVDKLNSNLHQKKTVTKKRVQLTTLSNFVSAKPEEKLLQTDCSGRNISKTVIDKNTVQDTGKTVQEKKRVSFVTLPKDELKSSNIQALTEVNTKIENKNTDVSSNIKMEKNVIQEREKENVGKKKRVAFITLPNNDVKASPSSRETLLTQFVAKLEENEISTSNDVEIKEKVSQQSEHSVEVKKKRVQLISLPKVEEKPTQSSRQNLLSKFITKMEEKDKKIKEINEREFSIPFNPHNTIEDEIK